MIEGLPPFSCSGLKDEPFYRNVPYIDAALAKKYGVLPTFFFYDHVRLDPRMPEIERHLMLQDPVDGPELYVHWNGDMWPPPPPSVRSMPLLLEVCGRPPARAPAGRPPAGRPPAEPALPPALIPLPPRVARAGRRLRALALPRARGHPRRVAGDPAPGDDGAVARDRQPPAAGPFAICRSPAFQLGLGLGLGFRV